MRQNITIEMHLKQITQVMTYMVGANQPNGDLNTNATKHYDRDAFETNNSGNDLHGQWRKST